MVAVVRFVLSVADRLVPGFIVRHLLRGFVTPGLTLTDLATDFRFICFLHLVLRLMAVMWPGFLSVGELLQCRYYWCDGLLLCWQTDSLRLGSVILHSASVMVVCVSLLYFLAPYNSAFVLCRRTDNTTSTMCSYQLLSQSDLIN